MKFGQICEIWTKLWYLVGLVKFGMVWYGLLWFGQNSEAACMSDGFPKTFSPPQSKAHIRALLLQKKIRTHKPGTGGGGGVDPLLRCFAMTPCALPSPCLDPALEVSIRWSYSVAMCYSCYATVTHCYILPTTYRGQTTKSPGNPGFPPWPSIN